MVRVAQSCDRFHRDEPIRNRRSDEEPHRALRVSRVMGDLSDTKVIQ